MPNQLSVTEWGAAPTGFEGAFLLQASGREAAGFKREVLEPWGLNN